MRRGLACQLFLCQAQQLHAAAEEGRSSSGYVCRQHAGPRPHRPPGPALDLPRELAESVGIEHWGRVPALNTNDVFIDDLVRRGRAFVHLIYLSRKRALRVGIAQLPPALVPAARAPARRPAPHRCPSLHAARPSPPAAPPLPARRRTPWPRRCPTSAPCSAPRAPWPPSPRATRLCRWVSPCCPRCPLSCCCAALCFVVGVWGSLCCAAGLPERKAAAAAGLQQGCGFVAHQGGPHQAEGGQGSWRQPPRPPPAELRLTAAVRAARRRARAGWVRSLLQLAERWNGEAPL